MITIAVSSRSLFQLEESNAIFEKDGQEAYDKHMRDTEKEPLQPGAAFHLVRKLLNLNAYCKEGEPFFNVVLLSRNSPDASMRILQSVMHHNLKIESAVFTAGRNRFDYAKQFNADLFLSASVDDAVNAIAAGIAAARISPNRSCVPDNSADNVVRIAFDGDSVVFSDESDLIFRREGLEAFNHHEKANENKLLEAGPLANLLIKLSKVQAALAECFSADDRPLRLGLVTARGLQVHGRVIRTLRAWGLNLDEAVFANGSPKGPFLKAFMADFFFDDSGRNITSALDHNITAGQVHFGEGGIVRD